MLPLQLVYVAKRNFFFFFSNHEVWFAVLKRAWTMNKQQANSRQFHYQSQKPNFVLLLWKTFINCYVFSTLNTLVFFRCSSWCRCLCRLMYVRISKEIDVMPCLSKLFSLSIDVFIKLLPISFYLRYLLAKILFWLQSFVCSLLESFVHHRLIL